MIKPLTPWRMALAAAALLLVMNGAAAAAPARQARAATPEAVPAPGGPAGGAAPSAAPETTPQAPPSGTAAPAGARDADASVAEPEGPPPVELGLQEAIHMAVERNLDIQVARLDPRQREQDIISSQSAFDVTLFGDINRSKSQSRATSAFASTSFSSDQFNAGASKLFSSGASATLSWNNTRSDQALGTASFQFENPTYNSNLRFSFTQPLLKGWLATAVRTNIRITRNNLEVSRDQVRRLIETNVRDTTRAYWDLAASISSLRVARESLELAQSLLKLNRAKVEVGTLAPIEITQAEAGVASREEAVIVAENSIRTAEDNLRRILNPARDSDLWSRPIVPKDEPSFEPMNLDLQGEVATALKGRSELEQRRIQLQNLELQNEADRAAYRPQVDFVGAYGYTGTAGDSPITKLVACVPGPSNPGCFLDTNGDGTADSKEVVVGKNNQGFSDAWTQIGNRDLPSWSVGVQASYPIGNRAAKATYARSRIAAEQGRLDLANVEQGIEIEVRNAVRQVQTNVKRVQAARVNVDLQRKKLDAEQKRFQYGMTTSFQVLTFQNDLTAAQSDEISATLDYNKSLADLAAATGTLLQKQGIEVE